MNQSPKSIFVRAGGLITICAIGALLVFPAIQQKALDGRVKSFLLKVQSGLQKYHVEEERYPEKSMKGRDLIALLVENGFLQKAPDNPWSETSDWLQYRTDSLAETYELITLIPGTEKVHYRLDSIENHSLEEN